LWDIEKGVIDEQCINGVDIIVHLAGASIADKPWTDERKKLIIQSRTKSIKLIYQLLKNETHGVKKIISASGIGYYGDKGEEVLTEHDPPAHDFLGTCCLEWEEAVDEGKALGLSILKFRTGVVLTKDGGALPQLAKLIKFGSGSPLGSGKQWVPWIHWQDVIDMYIHGIKNEDVTGVYNMVAPNPVTNKQMTQAIAKQLHKPLWLPNVPGFALKLFMGEMSTVVLSSTRASSKKIEKAGFTFMYPELTSALREIYGGTIIRLSKMI
jgi:uncharacterized protein (TIGR01777 family)